MINFNELPLLSLLIITLPVGAAIIWLDPTARYARWVALCTAIVDLFIALLVLFKFDASNSNHQFIDKADWIPTLNIYYKVGIDGLSVMFLPLTVILFIGVIIASWNSIRTLPRLYYTMLLLLESTTLGIFCSLDTVLFFLFWELTLIPGYFLISLWGIGPNRRYAAVKYTLFMLIGGIPILFAFVLLGFSFDGDGLMFDLLSLIASPPDEHIQTIVFFLLLIGFAIKIPVFPFHTWLPLIALEGPVAVAALMTGLKLGAYGVIRLAIPLAPNAALNYHWLLAGLGIFGMIYGALIALQQTNLRRFLAYSSISHVGLVILGVASFNMQGIQGAIYQLLNFTVIAGGLFLLTGFLHHRTGSTNMMNLGGAARTMPLLASFYFIFGLASIGIPGTNGFPAELLILISALKTHTGAGLAALFGIVLGAAGLVRSYRRSFFGPVTKNIVAEAEDLKRREIVVIGAMCLLIFLLGFYPGLVLETSRLASEAWLQQLGLGPVNQ